MNTVEFPKLGLEFSFNNVLFSIGGINIYIYGAIIALGLILAMVYAFKTFRKVGVDPDRAIDAVLGGIVGGIVGARLYYVLLSWDDFGLDFSSMDSFWHTFLRLFNTREGGMAIYGGLIGAVLVGVLIAKWRKINIKALLDVVGVGFLIGQGIGRWGNFFNVEAFGSNTDMPWGMTGPSIVNYLSSKAAYFKEIGVVVDPNMPVHPCFFYESIWCIAGAAVLMIYMKHRKFDGEVFLMYLGYYGLGRFFIEGLRTDSLMIGTLRFSQLLAAVLFIGAIISIIIVRSKIKSNHDENYLKLFALTDEGQKIVHNIKDDTEEEILEDIEDESEESSLLTAPEEKQDKKDGEKDE